MTKTLVRILLPALFLLALPGAAQDAYPNRQVRWVVPFPPAGPTDIIARIFAARLTEQWGQSVLVDNRGGAGGAIGAGLVAKAPADGYTIVQGTQSTHASNVSFFPNMPFDAVRDFAPLTLIGTSCLALIVPHSVPAASATELVDWIGKQNGAVSYGSAAAGTSPHVAGELFLKRTGVKATHIPYKGSAAAMQDVLGGRLAFMFDNLPTALPLARAGKVKALAQTCEKRSAAAPDLPTMKEALGTDVTVEGWYGIFAPAGTPRPIVEKLSADINRALRHPAAMERWASLGFDPIGSTPEVLAARQKSDIEYWRKMIELTGVKIE